MTTQQPVDTPRFPVLWLLVMSIGIGGSVAMREVAAQTGMSAGAFWAGVAVSGLVFGAGAVPFFGRFNAWTQARKAAGKSAWWERLP